MVGRTATRRPGPARRISIGVMMAAVAVLVGSIGVGQAVVAPGSAATTAVPPSAAGHALRSDYQIQMVYFVPSDSPDRNRGALMVQAVGKIKRQWARWGWQLRVNPELIRIDSGQSCAYFNEFDRLWDAARDELEARGQYSPTVKYQVFGECTSGGGAAQANQPGNVALYYDYVVDGIGLDDGSERNNSDIGAVGHEMGHNFGLLHENCQGEDNPDAVADLRSNALPVRATLGPMCNGGHWPGVKPVKYQRSLVLRYGCGWLRGCLKNNPRWVPAGTPGTGAGRGKAYASRASGLCMDVTSGDTSSDSRVVQWDCTGDTNQRVRMIRVGDGQVSLKFGHSGYCLSPVNRSKIRGAAMVQWACSAKDTATLWRKKRLGGGAYKLINVRSGRCLEASGEAGAAVVQWPCRGRDTQVWTRQSTF
jgi:hypothetical protein